VLASVAILAKRNAMWWASIGSGIIGVALAASMLLVKS
jgi:hypothetical protein